MQIVIRRAQLHMFPLATGLEWLLLSSSTLRCGFIHQVPEMEW